MSSSVAPYIPGSPASACPDLDRAIDKAASGTRLSRAEALVLYKEAPLAELGQLAFLARKRHNPGANVTYLIDRNINYTNVCNTDCSFCAFYRHDPKHPEAYVLPREVMRAKIEEALELGATRILLQGGHNDELPYSFYVEMISWISSNFKVEINAFSPSEIQQMKKVSGKSYAEILGELKAAGMRGLPGGGAEILDDQVRARVSPKKISADEWIAVMEVAHSTGLTTTSTMVIGFGETIEQRLNHLDRLRQAQDRSLQAGFKGFGAFISWPLQFNENTSIGRSRHASGYGAGATEYLRNVALCRLYLDNIQHHQSSWPTLGPEVAQLGLHFGCDDIGSTMMEENVVSQAGAPTARKWCMSPEELQAIIVQAGFTPAQRDTAYNILRLHEVDNVSA
ncbi:MAG: CofH family radical SAM protein [Oligoflexia bacterium]|nr:CofH family radical SAM protein [Oligoflexia bacterium]